MILGESFKTRGALQRIFTLQETLDRELAALALEEIPADRTHGFTEFARLKAAGWNVIARRMEELKAGDEPSDRHPWLMLRGTVCHCGASKQKWEPLCARCEELVRPELRPRLAEIGPEWPAAYRAAVAAVPAPETALSAGESREAALPF